MTDHDLDCALARITATLRELGALRSNLTDVMYELDDLRAMIDELIPGHAAGK